MSFNRSLAVFLILIFGLILAFGAVQRNSAAESKKQIEALCKSENELRQESNLRAKTHDLQSELTIDLATHLSDRLASEGRYHQAASIQITASDLHQSTAFNPVPLSDCNN